MASVVRFDKWEDSEGNPVLDASDGPINFPSRRNLLYNGAMQVAQRGTSATGITVDGYRTADRWRTFLGGSVGTWTQTVETDGPTGSGLTKSTKLLCTTAQPSVAAGDRMTFVQQLEGQDVQQIAKGTSGAKPLTLSFWVKSNVTGVYAVNPTVGTRGVSATYSISAANVWERKVITFPADTTGTITNDSNLGFTLNYFLVAGTDFTSGTLQTTWATTVTANRAVGQTNLAAATSNYWQITGVQLEVGPVATPFEFKSFGQELAECQRYYYKSPTAIIYVPSLRNTAVNRLNYMWPVTMRGQPSVSATGGSLGGGTIVIEAMSINGAQIGANNSTDSVFFTQVEASSEL
jgi:hypothetical protein